jgi:hypothetical protein
MDLFQWRTAVVSHTGPTSPVTRHVLLTLSLHMDKAGGSCFPSIATLVRETGLSNRSVLTHIDLAVEQGWIRRRTNAGSGQGWKRARYTAALPKVGNVISHEGGEPDSPASTDAVNEVHHEGSEGRSPRQAEGGEPRSKKVVKEVHSSSSVNSPEEGAVVAFCRMTGSSWSLKQPVGDWAGGLAADYPGIPIAREVKKAAEWHQSKRTNVKSPSQTIRNWLDRAKPSRNGTDPNDGMRITPAELRRRYG